MPKFYGKRCEFFYISLTQTTNDITQMYRMGALWMITNIRIFYNSQSFNNELNNIVNCNSDPNGTNET
jgi:hypothetical protein